MKNLIIIALLFTISCQSEDATIEYLNEGVNLGIGFLNDMNSDTYNNFEAAMHENPQEVKKHKDIVDKLSTQSKLLDIEIYSIINNLSLKIKTHDRIKSLRKNLKIYQEYIDSLAKDDSLLYKSKIKINLQFEDRDTNQLLILKNKITLLEKHVISRLYKNISYQNFRFNKRKVAVVPEKLELKKNEYYEADLLLLEYYTEFEFHFSIEGKTFNSEDGIIYYMDSNTSSPGLVNKKGTLFWQYRKTKKKIEEPLSFNYKILNQ